MPIEVCTIGGFSKTEGNSTAIKVDDEVILLDMGLSMENYIRYTEDREDVSAKTYKQLRRVDAVPNYSYIDEWKGHIKAIIPSHGHLDHLGAVPFAAHLFPDAPVVSTPYTIELLKRIVQDEKIDLPNEFISMKLNSTYKVSDKISIEFVNVTHSIPHTAILVVHTPYGKIMYANDFKLDLHPVLGPTPNFARLEQLGKEGVDLLIMECLYAHEQRKMPSESVAKQMLKDVMLSNSNTGKGMIVTTFSSHIARLKSIIEFGKKINRKIVFLGRSLSKYVKAAESINLVKFTQDIELVTYRDQVEKTLRKIMKEGKEKYLIACTGHQGESKAILSRLARKQHGWRFDHGDVVIFSCSTIPVELNIKNRERLERKLHSQKVRIFKDVHASGHGALEDYRELIEIVRPKHIIPAHAGNEKARMLASMAARIGFKNTHVMVDGGRFTLK